MTINTHVADGVSFVDKFLEHYGVKGMRWGHRKDRGRSKVALTMAPGQKVKTTGGTGQKASPDAVRAAIARQKAKESTTDALSNKELQALIKRLQMEQQYSQLRPKTPTEKSLAFAGGLLLNVGKNQVSSIVAQTVTRQVAAAMAPKPTHPGIDYINKTQGKRK